MPEPSTTEQLVQEAYDCVMEGSWHQLLASYAALAGAQSGMIYLRHGTDKAGSLLASLNYPASRVPEYLSYYEVRSPIRNLYKRLNESEIRELGEIAFSRAFRNTEYYQDWVRPQRYADMLSGHVVRRPQVYAWLSLRRAVDRGTYTPAAISAVRQVSPHITRAIALHAKLAAANAVVGTVQQIIEAMGFGILVVNIEAKILLANRAADELLQIADGLKSRQNRLGCVRHDQDVVLQQAISAMSKARSARDIHIDRITKSRPLTLHIVPISSLSVWQHVAPASAVAAIFVVDPIGYSPTTEGIGNAYGLTPAECRVLGELIAGGGLLQAAGRLKISEPTARTHLQHIFAKTMTSNQSDLIQLVLKSAVPIRP